MPPKMKFSDGEKVLCFHGPRLYEAKVVKAQAKDKQVKYFVHYNGWNKTWDEWVPENRVLKLNEANLMRQNELEEEYVKTKNKAAEANKKETGSESEGMSSTSPEKEKPSKQKGSATMVPTESAAEAPRQIRTRSEQNVEEEEDPLEFNIDIPAKLMSWLVDDFAFISHFKKLVSLPARVSVEDIIERYKKEKFEEQEMDIYDQASYSESCKGILEYFNTLLVQQLLYELEWPQRDDMIAQNPEKPMSQIYGATHLLRLFGKLERFLSYSRFDNEAITFLEDHFQQFLKFFADNIEDFLTVNDYEAASPEYLKRL